MIFVICCDVDPDVLGYNVPAARFDVYKEKLGWKGVEDNLPKVSEIRDLVKDSNSNNAKITWFVRSDEQMKLVFGDHAHPLRKFWELWKELVNQGDEIGWHPHFWRWSVERRCWHQEVCDERWMCECLERGHAEFVKLVKNLTSMRMGWGFHNNCTMRKVNDLGLTVDLSALPGIKHEGIPDVRGSHFVNEYDWSITPERPYHPSKEDYRRPKRGNEKSLRILEIPITTGPRGATKIFLQQALRSAPFKFRRILLRDQINDSTRVQHRNSANITSRSFRHLAKLKFRESTKNDQVLATFFHAIELSNPKSFSNFKDNLKTVVKLSQRSNVPFRFLTATETAHQLLKKDIWSNRETQK